MDFDAKRQVALHHAVSIIGGFLGGYAIYNHCNLFGNAQTANLIEIVCRVFSGNLLGIAFLVLALVTYILGNISFVVLDRFCKIDTRLISLLLTSCAVVVIGAFPNISNHYIAILPILFVTPIQWNAFDNAGGYTSSTIFSTNNLRQATVSLSRFIVDRDRAQGAKAKFFWMTLLCFHLGVAISCVASVFLGVESIWFCFVPIIVSAIAYMRALGFSLKNLTFRNI